MSVTAKRLKAHVKAISTAECEGSGQKAWLETDEAGGGVVACLGRHASTGNTIGAEFRR
jgi:hypothetical protein